MCVRSGPSKTLRPQMEEPRFSREHQDRTTGLILYQTSFPQIVIERGGKVDSRVKKSPSRTWFAIYNMPNSDASDLMFDSCMPFFFFSLGLLSLRKPFLVIGVLNGNN